MTRAVSKTSYPLDPASAIVPEATQIPDPVVAPEPPKIMKVCGTCKEWRANGSNPTFGQCTLSGKSLPAPLMTTDLTSCRAWNLAP